MAVRAKQYGEMMDKDMPGKSLMAQHKRAAGMSSTTRKADKFQKPSIGDKVILSMLRAKKKMMGGKKMMMDDREMKKGMKGM